MDNKNMEDKSLTSINKTKGMVLTGLLFAIAIVLSIIENSLPSIVIGVSGVKLGLSNIAVMYTLFFLTKKQAFIVAILKASFVFLTRGLIAGALSLSGGIASLVIMIILMLIFKRKISYLVTSIFGAVFHNIGQLFAVSIIFTSIYIWAYLPVLLIAGVLAGIATSTLLTFILPAFDKLGLK